MILLIEIRLCSSLAVSCYVLFISQEHNLYQKMREREGPFSEEEIRSMMSQLLQGLTYMHSNGYFHRDLKPGIFLFSSIFT